MGQVYLSAYRWRPLGLGGDGQGLLGAHTRGWGALPQGEAGRAAPVIRG